MGINDKKIQQTGQPGSVTNQNQAGSTDEKFVPTCSICGEKHWPHHPLVPCVNKRKAKTKAKADKKAKAQAAAQAK
ncbi:MAG: hypothetical protein WBC05_23010, partial [Sedimentisphaerales bacterium]